MRTFGILPAIPVLISIVLPMELAMAQQSKSHAEHLVEQVLDIWSQHNVEKVDDVFTEDGLYEDAALGELMRGREEIKTFLKENFSAVPNFKAELIRVFSTKNMAACEWIMSGTHTGDYAELAATGKSFSVRGASVVLFEDGKIKHWTDYYNMYDFLRQLGVVPEPTEQK